MAKLACALSRIGIWGHFLAVGIGFVSGSSCHNYTEGNPRCDFTFQYSTCTAIPYASCIGYAGCNLDGGCEARGCDSFKTKAECSEEETKCSWVAMPDGTSICRAANWTECSVFLDSVSCGSKRDCIWLEGCGGTLDGCEVYETEASCTAAAQCEWRDGSPE